MTTIALVLIGVGVAGAVATYLGYPLLLALTTRRRSSPSAPAVWPSLRVVVPVHNERELAVAKVSNLLAQDYPTDRLEVVVVDDGSTDGTAEQLQRKFGGRISILRLPKNVGKNRALNAAMAAGEGGPDLVGTSDADAFLSPGTLKKLVTALEDPAIGLAAARGVYDTPTDGGVPEQSYFGYEGWVRDLESRDGGCVSISGVLEIHRRALWKPLPPDVATDMATALAVLAQGQGVRVVHDAIVTTGVTKRVAAELHRKLRTVRRGLKAAEWRWPALGTPLRARLFAHKLLRYALPVFQTFILAGSFFVALDYPVLGSTLVLGQTALYGAVALGGICARRNAAGFGVGRLLAAAFYFQAVHLVACVELFRWAFRADHPEAAWGRARAEGVVVALETTNSQPAPEIARAQDRHVA